MQAQEAMSEPEQSGNARSRKLHSRHRVTDPAPGVPCGPAGTLRKRTGINHKLASR